MFGVGRSATFLLLALLAEVAGTVGGFGSSVFGLVTLCQAPGA